MFHLIVKWVALLLLVNLAHGADIHAYDVHAPRALAQRDVTISELGMNLDNKDVPREELKIKYWQDMGAREVYERINQPRNLNQAKNIIMFLGDGMSLSTQTAARIVKGQRAGFTGEEDKLNFEQFPYSGLSRTYCTNAQVPDSACTATAYLCGVKTNILNIGVSANVKFNDCNASMDASNHVSSIAAWAQAAGKLTGFITTTTLTHASPSGTYAHVANRLWESDADVKMFEHDPKTCKDIASQLVYDNPGRNFDVMMGGGMGKFVPNTIIDAHGNPGERLDGKNLLSEWQGLHPAGQIVTNRDQLLRLNVSAVSNIMGVFASKVMDFHLKCDRYYQPTLAEMTKVALEFLERKSGGKGYYIFIEGGLIDYGNHMNKAGISTDETLEMDKAIQLAREMTNKEDTLIVVTADHAHPLSIAGYPGRGNGILNLNNMGTDSEGTPYATLNYAVGPQQYRDEDGHREDLTGKMGGNDFIFPSQVNAEIGVHGGDDVGVYASGPYEHLFGGLMQQSTIPHLMAYAACIGNGAKMCDSS